MQQRYTYVSQSIMTFRPASYTINFLFKGTDISENFVGICSNVYPIVYNIYTVPLSAKAC